MLCQGQRVGEYILDREIGRGRFGQVWLSRHHVWSDQVVVAKIPTDDQYLRVLHHEGRVLQGLCHPNVIRALALDPYAQTPYLIMEYVEGSSLRPLILGHLLNVDLALKILEQVLKGLAYAHQRGVVHCDIKPENVLIDQRVGSEGFDAIGRVKVGDFGLGRSTLLLEGGQSSSIIFSGSVDKRGQHFGGTPGYIAPEVSEGAVADARSDLYACGILLYEMLMWWRPVGAASLAGLSTPIAPHLDEMFRRTYAPSDQRFSSAEEFLDAVREARDLLANGNVERAPIPGSASNPRDSEEQAAAQEAQAAEAEARVRNVWASQYQAQARSEQAGADYEGARARREAAAAERERWAAQRQEAKAQRLRAEAEVERLKGVNRAARQRQKAAEQRARAEAAESARLRQERESQHELRAAKTRVSLRTVRASERAALERRNRIWGRRAAIAVAVVGGWWLISEYFAVVLIAAGVLWTAALLYSLRTRDLDENR
ncbi:MAG: helicase II/ATP-dependent helicase PcrA [Phycisphaerales bacterium]|nr:helicase II/ATP-dependent helicase PcrA [Phycisphaerales bacterium]